MSLTLKRAFIVFFMILSLLAGLFGWEMRMNSFPTMHHQTGVHATQLLAVRKPICPPPPTVC